jgi:acyl carrier protein/NAD(P)-dependent dehydrogenase (short-subunit alcohol dehydrogenase family)
MTAAVSAPAMTTAVVSSGGSSVVGDKIKTIIAEMTGYGIEMLDTNLDLEADLGIDTVKQVEIFGKICEQFGVAIPEDLKLTELNNIEKLAAFIAAKAGIVDAPVAAAVAHVAPVMTTAVASSGGSSVVSDKIKTIISEMTGYGVEMLDTNLDLEADLGIDTVKQVEIFGKICEQFGVAIPEDLKLTELNNIEKLAAFIAAKAGIVDAPVAAAAPVGRHASLAAVQSAAPASGVYLTDVTNVIAEMTGYGVEMLDSNLDLEGDLGIDTVKQVEIFGKVCEKFGIAVPEDLRLTELNTIAKLAAFIAEKTGHAAPAAPVAMAAASSAPAVQSAPVQSMTVAAAPSSADGSAYLADVTNVIAEMTGYGVEMLDSNLDLESDLGIDTVKQVEIFGKACEKFGIAVPEDLRLTELNTIAKLAAFIAGVKDGVSATPAATADTSTSAATDMALPKSSITRFVVRPIPAPQVQETKDFFKGKKVIITADAKGLANKIGERITSRGGSVQYIGKNDLDFGNLSAVEKKFTELSAGGIDGLIHAMTLDGYFDGMKTDKVTVDAAVKSLFVMIKSLGKNLNKNGAFVAAPSFDSVIFPYTDTKAKIYPVFGAVSGMLKSVNKEYKDTRVKAIDFSGDYAKKLDDCADLFITELSGSDARVESGYKKGERFKITIVDEPVSAKTPFVSEGDVVLLSGGARGITFEILKELVKQYKVRPVILARSEITSIDQDFLKDGADEKYIFGVLAQKMAGAKPLEIKKAAAKALNQRDTVRNIRVLEAMGVEVKYHAVDVTNADAVKKIVAQYEKIDGVIHAAGVEESQLIEKKDMKTFDLVFDTKIDGVRSLIGALEGKTYRYFIGFSSVAARFGNEGQTDYSAANEMLARTLQAEKRRFADRIYKVYDWTAWGEVGMATKESVMKFLTAQGVQLLPVKLGVNLFMSDLNDPKEEEVVITNLMPAFDRDGIFSVTAPGDGSEKTPFLGRKVEESKGYAKFLRTLDLKNDIFLPDHALNGVPLFLGSTGVETMAEAASQLMGKGKTLVEMREFTIPYGIKILQGKPKDILVDARALSDDEAECSIKSQFVKDGKPLGDATIHYNGIYRFASKAPEAVTIKIPKLKKVTWEGNLDEHLYHPKRLFMFGLFKSISDIIGVNDSSMVAVIHNKHKGPFFANIVRPAFQTNPVVVDGAFQICGLSEFLTGSESILPYRIRKMQFFRKVETHDEYICVVKNTGRDDNEKTRSFDVDLADRDGNLFFRIEGFQMIAVEKLAEEFRIAHKFKVV